MGSSTVPDGMGSARSSPEGPENLVNKLPWVMAHYIILVCRQVVELTGSATHAWK